MGVEAETRLEVGDHVVQFYDRTEELVGVVAGYLGAALSDGDGVVVIATPAHRAALDAALSVSGIDAAHAASEGRLVALDAASTLSRFMVGDRPHPALFDGSVGETVRRLAADTGRPVRAYGEMVAVLWEAGNGEGALQVERLWNELGDSVPFSLFCGYPAGTVDGAVDAICGLHSRVVSAQRLAASCRFGRSPRAPGLSRRFVTDTLRGWRCLDDLVDDAAVVVSELATNAISHAQCDFTVSLAPIDHGIRVAVSDTSPAAPALSRSDNDAVGGRGLVLVDRIAQRWGHTVTAGGKFVWAEITAPTSPGC